MSWANASPQMDHWRSEVAATTAWSTTLAATEDDIHSHLSDATDDLPKMVLNEEPEEIDGFSDAGPRLFAGSFRGCYFNDGDRGAVRRELESVLAATARSNTPLVGYRYRIEAEDGAGPARRAAGSTVTAVPFHVFYEISVL
jgi:hypothetical protein